MNNVGMTLIVRTCCLLVLLFALAGCSAESSRSLSSVSGKGKTDSKGAPPAANEVASSTAVLSTVANLAAKEEIEVPNVLFSAQGHGVAYVAKKDGKLQVVHNDKADRPYSVIGHLQLSLDGRHVAYDALVDGRRRMVLDGREGNPYDDVWEPVFSPDSRHLAYVAQIGGQRLVVVDGKNSERFPGFAFNPVFSADSSRIAYVENASEGRKARLIVSDLAMSRQIITKEIADEDLVVNKERTRIAAIGISNNKQRVVEIGFTQPDKVTEGPSYDSVEKVVFGSNGRSLAYVAKDGGESFLVLNDRKERLPDSGMRESPVVLSDGKGAGIILISGDGKYYYHQAFVDAKVQSKKYDEAAQLVYNADGSQYAYCAKMGKKLFVVVNGKEGPPFDMVISPQFAPDGRLLVYRARKDGWRFVVVADAEGNIVRKYPGYEMVFDILFTADGKSVAYGAKAGDKLVWKVEKL